MPAAVSMSIEEKILAASKIMVNILAQSLLHGKNRSLSAPQFRILDMVYHVTDKPTDIAKMLDVSPPSITWMLERLEKGGFLKREMSTKDRRRIVLTLTGMGKDVVERVNARRMAYIYRILKMMDAKTVRQLDESLSAFSDSYLRLKED